MLKKQMENKTAQVLVHVTNQQQTDKYHLWNPRTPSAVTQSLGHFPSAGCKRLSLIKTCISLDSFFLSFSLCLMKGSTAT